MPKKSLTALTYIIPSRLKVPCVPRIGNTSFISRIGHEQVNFIFRIVFDESAHISQIIVVHSNNIVKIFVVIGGHLTGKFAVAGYAVFGKNFLCGWIDRISYFFGGGWEVAQDSI